jgi:hypothetical protein
MAVLVFAHSDIGRAELQIVAAPDVIAAGAGIR